MKTKNINPSRFLVGIPLDSALELYFQINHLKQLYRQGWLRSGRDVPKGQCESVADHVFGLSMLALFVTDLYFPSLDQLKVIKMCLIHELGEIIVGDLPSPKSDMEREGKRKAEHMAISMLLDDCPNGDEYLRFWEEFEEGKSPEAKLVRQLDKLEMACQAKVYSLQHGNHFQEFFDDVRGQLETEELKKILREVESI